MMVFFQTRLGKNLIWQKFSGTWKSDFKEETCSVHIKSVVGLKAKVHIFITEVQYGLDKDTKKGKNYYEYNKVKGVKKCWW